jgi:hypothetical protein
MQKVFKRSYMLEKVPAASPRFRCITALALAASLFAIGCHSKTAATPENFIQTLNAHFLDRHECLFPDAPRFPFETSDPVKTKQMNTLVVSQLLTVQTEPAIHVSRYSVTTTGARFAPRFCYGHRQVTAIDSFTPPAVANGFPETRVTFRYNLEDVPVWAKSANVREAFPAMAKATTETGTDTLTLARTIAGWTVPD